MISDERISEFIKKMEEFFSEQGISVEIRQDFSPDDPRDNLNIDDIAVDTGIEDFAENHDHYLYGTGLRHICGAKKVLTFGAVLGYKNKIFKKPDKLYRLIGTARLSVSESPDINVSLKAPT